MFVKQCSWNLYPEVITMILFSVRMHSITVRMLFTSKVSNRYRKGKWFRVKELEWSKSVAIKRICQRLQSPYWMECSREPSRFQLWSAVQRCQKKESLFQAPNWKCIFQLVSLNQKRKLPFRRDLKGTLWRCWNTDTLILWWYSLERKS